MEASDAPRLGESTTTDCNDKVTTVLHFASRLAELARASDEHPGKVRTVLHFAPRLSELARASEDRF